MKIWFDTEFIERGGDYPIQIISIGMVREDGAELYLESNEFDASAASPWVMANVLSRLGPESERISRAEIKERVIEFCGPQPEFWAYYCAFDWVVLEQLMGGMEYLPKGWPIYSHDIKLWAETLGDPALPEQPPGFHNALVDARWNVEAWRYLATLSAAPVR